MLTTICFVGTMQWIHNQETTVPAGASGRKLFMDSGSIYSILTIILLVGCSAFFSASETAYSTLNRIRIKNMAEKGSKNAKLVLELSGQYDKLLSTILVGNNIVNIAMTSIATVLFIKHFPTYGATISTIIITLVVLTFGEISPKTLAKESAEPFALFAAPILRVLVVVLSPVNSLFTQWKKLLSKLIKPKGSHSMTEEELLTMVEEAEQEGAIDREDTELIHNVIEFNDSKVNEILTPRVDIEAVPVDAALDAVTALFLETGYSRLPVYDSSVDDIIGVIHLRDYFEMITQGKQKLGDIVN